MTLLIILIVLSAVLCYLLFMKMVLYVDTANNEYYVQAKGLVKAKIETHDTELIQIKFKTLFIKFSFLPLRKSKKKKKKTKTDKTIVSKRSAIEIQRLFRIRVDQTFSFASHSSKPSSSYPSSSRSPSTLRPDSA